MPARKLFKKIHLLKAGDDLLVLGKFVVEKEADLLLSLLEDREIKTILETGVGYTTCRIVDKFFSNGNVKGKKLITIGSDLVESEKLKRKRHDNGLNFWSIRHKVPKKYLSKKHGRKVSDVWDWHNVEIKENLGKILKEYQNLKIDLFFHDSDHSSEHMFFEWNSIEPYLSENAYFASHEYGRWEYGGEKFFDWFEKEKVKSGEWKRIGLVESMICYKKNK